MDERSDACECFSSASRGAVCAQKARAGGRGEGAKRSSRTANAQRSSSWEGPNSKSRSMASRFVINSAIPSPCLSAGC